jgi:hypothetical protein
MSAAIWTAKSTQRFYPASPTESRNRITLHAALNEKVSFQAVMRLDDPEPHRVQVSTETPDGWTARIRRVGYVPVKHLNTRLAEGPLEVDGADFLPGYAPDPLFEESEFLLPPRETHAFRITCVPPPDADPGTVTIRARVAIDGGPSRTVTCRVVLHDVRLQPRRDFPITHWFYADAISDWYNAPLFGSDFWQLCKAYMANYTAHGLDMMYVPVFTPPLDGVKKPTQLLRVHRIQPETYEFDWSDVEKWVRAATGAGITSFEWTHPFTQWGARNAIRIYEGQGQHEQLLWTPDTKATSDTYRTFLSQYLPQLKSFLDQNRLLNASVFHVSDEPHTEEDKNHYRAARQMLKDIAPWMRTMDALTDVEYGRLNLTDMPVPSIKTALEFQREGIESWCYYCCGPRGAFLNRLIDTPLPKIAMHGFLLYRWPFKGFLHWGYNYWYRSQTRELIDPYTVQDGHAWPGWAYGDTFQVYPGPNGPVDSLRWETFSESLQDYQLLQTLAISRDSDLLKPIRAFDDFPKNARWREQVKQKLLQNAGR